VCTGAVCQAPSPTDTVKNGDETDVDCGGASGKKCDVGKQCAIHADCVQDACMPGAPYGRCTAARSCRQHNGGETCGAGEPGEATAVHEDCCTSIAVPRPAASGGPFELDKYMITAGRMRAFLDEVNWNPKAWITANKPAWWVDAFTDMLPEDKPGVLVGTLADSASGCYAKGRGAPALWFSPDELAGVRDVRTYTQDQMDTKVMNCFHAPLFHALCAFDGKRMPSLDDWKYAWQGGDANRKYPWGNDTDFGAHAAQNFNYFWPTQPGEDGDWGGYLPAPGRFPQGAGPYGHMDLGGIVENMGLQKSGNGYAGDGWFQWSFQEPTQSGHPFAQQSAGFGSGAYRPHWAVGGRCRSL
jgi:formylglycine-generating enzyme required for sulfatase activity